jgi:SAM-dependent methyltransferase
MFDFPFRLLAVQRKGNLLEVGCGDGGSLEIARQFGWNTVGVDFDSKAVDNARSKGLDVHHGQLQNLHLADNSFDMILMNHVIEHVHDPLGLLRECYRILRRGGRFAMLTPNSESWGCSYFRGDWRGLEPPRHIHIFNCQTLRELGRKAGFAGADISSPIRSAGWMLLQSRVIYRTRLGLAPLRLSRFRVWLFSSCVVMMEELMSKLWPLFGEELRFEAEK